MGSIQTSAKTYHKSFIFVNVFMCNIREIWYLAYIMLTSSQIKVLKLLY